MNDIYDYRNCQSLFGYATSVHMRSGGICQLCGCGSGKKVDFDLWRQMTVEHLIGESQGGYLHQIKKTLSEKSPELPSNILEKLAKRIDDLNTVTACSFCNASTSRTQHDISMTELIKNTEGTLDEVIVSITKELNGILNKKKSIIQWKLLSIKKAFEKDIRPVLEQARYGFQTDKFTATPSHESFEHLDEVVDDEVTQNIPNIKDKIMIKFVDDDKGYLRWIRENPSGYVVNCDRTPKSEYLMLHRADCWTIMNATRGPGNWTTSDYIKICSLDKTELKKWAEDEVGGELQPCPRCNKLQV